LTGGILLNGAVCPLGPFKGEICKDSLQMDQAVRLTIISSFIDRS